MRNDAAKGAGALGQILGAAFWAGILFGNVLSATEFAMNRSTYTASAMLVTVNLGLALGEPSEAQVQEQKTDGIGADPSGAQ